MERETKHEVGVRLFDFEIDDVLVVDLGPDILQKLKSNIMKDWQSFKPANNTLAGQIKDEYALPDNLKKDVDRLVSQFIPHYDLEGYLSDLKYFGDVFWKFKLDNAWVNFQKKHEYNPVHRHTGILSFVIWLQIPYTMEDELQHSSYKDDCVNGCFQFITANTRGNFRTNQITTDKSWENKMILFPADMLHCVYPFYTSDDYRISISGNYVLDQ
tara:strand:- start:986 stop:1627 length:642 start_codon:yes stop_codon:yes gene_type:complete